MTEQTGPGACDGTLPASYTYSLDEAELARYRAMAQRASASESGLWIAAGITPGAVVLDLGCGPGAFLATLWSLVAPNGTVLGIDSDPAAVAKANALVRQASLPTTRIVRADATATGLPPGSLDVVFARNLLVHNGTRAGQILEHVRALLRPAARLVCAEPDVGGIEFGAHQAERELEQHWAAMTRADGNDPALGRDDRLPRLLGEHGFEVIAKQARLDRLSVNRSPAWSARNHLVNRGFATAADVSRWQAAIETRLRTTGPLPCTLPLTVVVACPA